jgi:glutathione S-transferase
VTKFYDQPEQLLEESKFIAEQRFTIADITALCVVDFAAFARPPTPERNIHTKRWHAAVSARASGAA